MRYANRPAATRALRRIAALLLAVGSGSMTAQAGETRALVAAGLGGTPDFELEFQRHAKRAATRLREVTEDVTVLVGDTADRDTLETVLHALAGRSSSDDTLVFIYVGHGSYDEEHFKFNVTGPDFTGVELKNWLGEIPAQHQLVVVTGSSSGALQLVLEQDGRTVITGTRSGGQRNATVFGAYFTAALAEEAADLDKDQRITALEAFNYAEAGVERHYATENEMSVEHPLSRGPEPMMVLAHLESLPEVNPEQAHLYAQREALELDIMALQDSKDSFETDEYLGELQKLLLELAMVEQQLTEAEGSANPSPATERHP